MNIVDSFKLNGKKALVTGGNTGLGRGMAVALAQAGADIAVVARRKAEDTRSDVETLGRKFLEIQADLGAPGPMSTNMKTIIDEVFDVFGSIDILVNNAGIIRREESLDFSEEDWDSVMDVNLKSLFFLSQAAAAHMKDTGRGGKIVNVASMLSYQGGIRVPSYTASKSGVLGLTRVMANDWGKYGINVNGIAPGYMDTDNTEALRADPIRNKQILDRIPSGRWGRPEDMGGAVVFLASSASDYMQGFTLAVDGGWLSR